MNYKIFSVIALSALMFSSCGVITKTYRQPDSSVADSLFRNSDSKDSASLADMPWQKLFPDPKLQGLIAEGLANNPDLNSAMERMKEANATLTQRSLSLLPSFGASAEASRINPSDNASGTVKPAYNLFEGSLSASWELDVWGKLSSKRKAALASYLQTEAAKRAIQTALIANIADNYYTLLALDEQLSIIHQTVEIRTKDVESMKVMKASAIVNGAAVVQSQANLYSAEVSIPDLQQRIRETENAICMLTGKVPGPVARNAFAQQMLPAELKTGVSGLLLKNRPDVQEAELALREAFENVNVARADFYPSLSITANGGLSSLSLSNFLTNSLFYNLVGGITQPIFNNGQNVANLKIAKAKQQEAFNDFRKVLLTAGQEVSNALFAYQTADAKDTSRVKQLEALEKSVEFTRALLQYSSATNYTDVLTSEQSLLSAQLSAVNDKLQKMQAVIELYRALGGGWK